MKIQNSLPIQGTQVSQGPKDKILLEVDYDLDVQILETSKQPNIEGNLSGYTCGHCSGGYTCGKCSGAHTCGNCS